MADAKDKEPSPIALKAQEDRLTLARTVKSVVTDLARPKDLDANRPVDPKLVNAQVQEALDLGYTTVWRKLTGEVAWSLEELAAVARKFKVSTGEFLRRIGLQAEETLKGRCLIDGREVMLDLVIGPQLTEEAGLPPLVAVRRGQTWRVIDSQAKDSDERCYSIARMDLPAGVLRSPTVALLDDDSLITEQASKLLGLYSGLTCRAFSSKEEILNALEQGAKFDAFVVDWLLGAETAQTVIEAIRTQDAHKRAPLFVVTGALGNHDNSNIEDALANVVRKFSCMAREKPLRWKILGEEVVQAIRGVDA